MHFDKDIEFHKYLRLCISTKHDNLLTIVAFEYSAHDLHCSCTYSNFKIITVPRKYYITLHSLLRYKRFAFG